MFQVILFLILFTGLQSLVLIIAPDPVKKKKNQTDGKD